MNSKDRNMLIAGGIGALCLGPLGAAAVAWAAHAMTPDDGSDTLTAKDFSVWMGDEFVCAVDPEKMRDAMSSLSSNEQNFDTEACRIGIRWSDDSAEYMSYREFQSVYA